MVEENKQLYLVIFKEEFDLCLDKIEDFFAEQGMETLLWWHSKEDQIIDYIGFMLSYNPFIGQSVNRGAFKGLRRIVYGKNRHSMLNYLIYYKIREQDRVIDVINIVPSRTKRKRIK